MTAPAGDSLGPLVILGGAARPRAVLERMVAAAGGPGAAIVVVPAASGDPEASAGIMAREFSDVGAGRVVIGPADRAQAEDEATVESVASAGAVYLTGGDQSRLRAALWGTPFFSALVELRRRGGLVAGSSAGAAVMGDLMLTGEELGLPDDAPAYARLRAGVVETLPGFALWPGVIVDQHFVARRRNNRLLSLVLEHPGLVGVGIDESTAVVVEAPDRLEVLGEATVVVYDARSARGLEPEREGVQGGRDLRLHVLRHGDVLQL